MQRCGEFRESKEDKKSEAHPAKPEKGETGCVSGAGGDEDGWEQQKPGEETRRGMHPIPIQLMQKGNRRKPSVSAGFAAGTEGLGHACCPGCRSQWGAPSTSRGGSRDRRGRAPQVASAPRHAVLEWMWEQRIENGEGAALANFSCKSEKLRCCSGATDSLGPNS